MPRPSVTRMVISCAFITRCPSASVYEGARPPLSTTTTSPSCRPTRAGSRLAMPALPMAARMRPRLGSEAKNAVFTSGELAIDLATAKHSPTDSPSSTWMVMNLVAPSPSRTMACARSCATSTTVTESWPNSCVPSPRISGLPARPVATSRSVSLVEVSPSTEMALNERLATRRARYCSESSAMQASVAITPSMVAMLGSIMPAPLAIPVTVIVRPSITTSRETALGTVSVVMIASAASAQWPGARSATHCGMPATMRSTGSGSMITPVDSGSTCAWCTPSASPTAAHTARALSRPASPVPALATPVFTTIARGLKCSLARCDLQTFTGAAAKRLRVKTPATRAPSSRASSSKSFRLGLRTCALAMPRRTPFTASRSEAFGGWMFTAMIARIICGLEGTSAQERSTVFHSFKTYSRHRVNVGPLARAQREGLVGALDLEAVLAVERDGALVVGEDRELEAEDVQPVVGDADQRLHQRVAHALPLELGAHRHADVARVSAPRRGLREVHAGVARDLALHQGEQQVVVGTVALEA